LQSTYFSPHLLPCMLYADPLLGVSSVVDDFLGRLMAELQSRIFDGPVSMLSMWCCKSYMTGMVLCCTCGVTSVSMQVLHLTPLADAQIPAASWAIASAYAPATLRHRWNNRSLTSLQDFSPPQPESQARSEHPLQDTTATAIRSASLTGNSSLTATEDAAAAEAKPPDIAMQVCQLCANASC
jgi:hypothetical protein